MDSDISIISSKIDSEKDNLKDLSSQIWENPELNHEEIFAHGLLTEALEKYGFEVKKHYFLPTAFRGEFCNRANGGPTIAVLCEYDALPEIGHACGHNLIAEAGIAAGLAVKATMEEDAAIHGKIVVLGTPAEEGGFGKVRLIERGAFNDIDIALMVHPAPTGCIFPIILCVTQATVTFIGKESHAACYPWEGKNALDAAVACYNNVALLRQQIKPTCKIHGIITKGGTFINIIPAETELQFGIRAPTTKELASLKTRLEKCFKGAALAADCDVKIRFDEDIYENLIGNNVLATMFKTYAQSFGLDIPDVDPSIIASTDMGNVSHIVPALQPAYSIGGNSVNHTKDFTKQAASEEAQVATLATAKTLAAVVIKLMKCPKLLQDVKDVFQMDLIKESENY